MVLQGDFVAQQAGGLVAEIGGQYVRVCPGSPGRQAEGACIGAGAAINPTANLHFNRMTKGQVVGGPGRHRPSQVNGVADPHSGEIHHRRREVETGGRRCGGCSAANQVARHDQRESENRELAIHALQT